MKVSYLILILLTLSYISCKTIKIPAHTSELQTLKVMMIGSFDSEAQSKIDTNFYNISLHMYPIWEDKGDYLYVEQALKTKQNKPYRQRIYKLEEIGNGEFKSSVYKIDKEENYVGKWNDVDFFNNYDESILTEREGCAVFLKKSLQSFKGSTQEEHCKSTLRGASYATSEVEISPTKIISWDQGFNELGEQVWGAETGGYIFERIIFQN